MARDRNPTRDRGPRPDRPPAPGRARSRRLYAIAASWLFIVVFLVGPVLLGNYLFVIPAVGFTVAALATTRMARSPSSPDAETLAPGALGRATRTAPVEVHGVWSAGAAVRASAADKGVLRVADGRISFLTATGETGFDTPVKKVGLAAVPGFWRPQLDLDVNGVTHTIRFFPIWDLGATIVGPVVAGEWYAQLRELGAR